MWAYIVSLVITLAAVDGSTYSRYLPMSEPVATYKQCTPKLDAARDLNPGYRFICQRVKIKHNKP